MNEISYPIKQSFRYISLFKCHMRTLTLFIGLTFYAVIIYFLWTVVQDATNKLKKPAKIPCYQCKNGLVTEDMQLPMLDIFYDTNIKSTTQSSIFFVETSCCDGEHKQWADLDMQDACALESAARHNNESEIYVLFVRPALRPLLYPTSNFMNLYKNVHFYNMNVSNLFAHSPLREVYTIEQIMKIFSLHSDLSEVFRLMLLWRYGGIYLDFTTITLRSLKDLPANAIGWDGVASMGINVLKFSLNVKARSMLKEILLAYVYFCQSFECPELKDVVSDFIGRHCPYPRKIHMQQNCAGIDVLPKNAFNEINASSIWFGAINKNYLKLLKLHKNSFVFNGMVEIRSGWNRKTILSHFASEHCPNVYKTFPFKGD